jgi:hypothetical protein
MKMLTRIIELASFRYRSHLSEGYQKELWLTQPINVNGTFLGQTSCIFSAAFMI